MTLFTLLDENINVCYSKKTQQMVNPLLCQGNGTATFAAGKQHLDEVNAPAWRGIGGPNRANRPAPVA